MALCFGSPRKLTHWVPTNVQEGFSGVEFTVTLTVTMGSLTVRGAHFTAGNKSLEKWCTEAIIPLINSRANQNICDSKTQVHSHSTPGLWRTSPDAFAGWDKVACRRPSRPSHQLWCTILQSLHLRYSLKWTMETETWIKQCIWFQPSPCSQRRSQRQPYFYLIYQLCYLKRNES